MKIKKKGGGGKRRARIDKSFIMGRRNAPESAKSIQLRRRKRQRCTHLKLCGIISGNSGIIKDAIKHFPPRLHFPYLSVATIIIRKFEFSASSAPTSRSTDERISHRNHRVQELARRISKGSDFSAGRAEATSELRRFLRPRDHQCAAQSARDNGGIIALTECVAPLYHRLTMPSSVRSFSSFTLIVYRSRLSVAQRTQRDKVILIIVLAQRRDNATTTTLSSRSSASARAHETEFFILTNDSLERI